MQAKANPVVAGLIFGSNNNETTIDDKMKPTGKNIDVKVGNVIVSYNDFGPEQAPVLIFIHGLALSKDMWQKQADSLKHEYRVIAYDVRGHGKSEVGKEEFSIELFVDDLHRFMDILEIEKAVICGLSMGGYIALRFMEKYAERSSALVLCDTQCIADTPEAKEKRMKAIDSIRQGGKTAFAQQNAKNIFSPESFTTRPADVQAAVDMALQMEPEAICSTLLALAMRNETCTLLDEIKVPTLILVGNDDKLTPPERSQFMHSNIKNSTLCILNGAAHLSNIENPEAFNTSLQAFLKKVIL